MVEDDILFTNPLAGKGLKLQDEGNTNDWQPGNIIQKIYFLINHRSSTISTKANAYVWQ